jgi:thymidine phosphorylase
VTAHVISAKTGQGTADVVMDVKAGLGNPKTLNPKP